MNSHRHKPIDPNIPANEPPSDPTRRSLFHSGALAIGGLAVLSSATQTLDASSAKRSSKPLSSGSFLELIRVPDAIAVYDRFEKTLPRNKLPLDKKGERWHGKQVEVVTNVERDALILSLASPSLPVSAVHVRWHANVKPQLQVLGDAWERSYGELGWRNIIPERPMPWYFATWDGTSSNGYGVKTDARALCFWQIDPDGVSLWLNTSNGGNGVELGQRRLQMATIVSQRGAPGMDTFDCITELCKTMCARTSRQRIPVFGANDWNYSYGQSTAETILRDTNNIVQLSPPGSIRPFSVIDGGWSSGTPEWPDMGKLASDIKRTTARPGLWIRPLEAPAGASRNLLLPDNRFGEKGERARELAYDPTVPEASEKISAKMQQAVDWGYEMVKHDFSTYDLLGQWGFEMGPQPTLPGWSLYDRTRTNAEVIADLYVLLRKTAGDRLLIDGCNTIGHLGQGIFDMQRIGDDTSGHQWERTRRMGVNTLSFRLPQNGTFFVVDPDLVGITEAVPWDFNRQWLELLARSGAATIISAAPSSLGQAQKSAIRDAFQLAAAGGASARPIDWSESSTPEKWQDGGHAAAKKQQHQYRWSAADGASPFLSS